MKENKEPYVIISSDVEMNHLRFHGTYHSSKSAADNLLKLGKLFRENNEERLIWIEKLD